MTVRQAQGDLLRLDYARREGVVETSPFGRPQGGRGFDLQQSGRRVKSEARLLRRVEDAASRNDRVGVTLRLAQGDLLRLDYARRDGGGATALSLLPAKWLDRSLRAVALGVVTR